MNESVTLDPPAAPAPPSSHDAPVWDAVREEIRCPLCAYQLRGLTEPRCPECGYRFEWRPLLDPTVRRHPYVFEHHPERNLWSFARTMLGTLLPRRFWRSIHPAQPSRPRRLLLYWLLSALLAFVAPLAVAGHKMYVDGRENNAWRTANLAKLKAALDRPASQWASWMVEDVDRAGGAQAYLARSEKAWLVAPSPRWVGQWLRRYDYGGALAVPLLYAAWPGLTLATLLVFAASMRRAKVRTVHVLRCAVYCCDTGLWLAPLASVAAAVALAPGGPLYPPPHGLLDRQVILLCAGPVFAVYTAYRLSAAYRLYLRFDRPLATALAAQFVLALAVFVAILNVPPI